MTPEYFDPDLLHALLKTGSLLPEQTLPCGEVRALKERVLQNTFHATQGLNSYNRGVQVKVGEKVGLRGRCRTADSRKRGGDSCWRPATLRL